MYNWEPDYDGPGSSGEARAMAAYELPRGSLRRHSYMVMDNATFKRTTTAGLRRRWSDDVSPVSTMRGQLKDSPEEEEEEDEFVEEPEPLRLPRVRASYNIINTAEPAASSSPDAPAITSGDTKDAMPGSSSSAVPDGAEAKSPAVDEDEDEEAKEIHPFIPIGNGRVRLTVRRTKPLLGLVIEGGCNTEQPLPRIVGIHPKGAAHEAGILRPGQQLLEVQGVPTNRLTHAHVARLLADAYYSGGGGEGGVTLIIEPLEPRRRFSFFWDADSEA
ncbi:whirlin-like [Ornithodoros turicata]